MLVELNNSNRKRSEKLIKRLVTNNQKWWDKYSRSCSAAPAPAARPGPGPLAIPGVTPVPPETDKCASYQTELWYDKYTTHNMTISNSKDGRTSCLWSHSCSSCAYPCSCSCSCCGSSCDRVTCCDSCHAPCKKSLFLSSLQNRYHVRKGRSYKCSTWSHPCLVQAFQRQWWSSSRGRRRFAHSAGPLRPNKHCSAFTAQQGSGPSAYSHFRLGEPSSA